MRNLRIAVVSLHEPRVDGTAAGRALAALRDGLVAHGHDVVVHVWSFDQRPTDMAASGTRRVVIDPGPPLVRRARALVSPRTDAAQHPWERELDAFDLVVADDPVSWPAVERARVRGAHAWEALATFHYATTLDAAAVGRRSLRDVQDVRAERRVARAAPVVHAYSARVADAIRSWQGSRHVVAVPIAYDPGHPPPPIVDEPVVALLANWDWPPNRVALDRLLGLWPAVRDRVPGARLRLAGRGGLEVGTLSGVEVVGPVADSTAFLAEAATVVFPCPPSSGPKVKVLEAAAAGRVVVTSPSGIEGFAEAREGAGAGGGLRDTPRGAVVVPSRDRTAWVEAVVAVLEDPARRAELGAAGRHAVETHHAPTVAAARRLAASDGA